jgi:hypothetical protein
MAVGGKLGGRRRLAAITGAGGQSGRRAAAGFERHPARRLIPALTGLSRPCCS